MVNGCDLRYPNARDDARGADRSGANANLDRIDSRADQIATTLGGGYVTCHHVDVPTFFKFLYGFNDIGRMSMSAVDHQEVDTLVDQAGDPIVVLHTNGRSNAESSLSVLRSLWESPHHVDVFDRNQARQFVFFVNQQKFLDLFCH